MPDTKLLALDAVVTPIPTDPFYTVQAGVDKRVTLAQIIAARGDYAGVHICSNTNETTIYAPNIPTQLVDFDKDMSELVSDSDFANNRVVVGASIAYLIGVNNDGESKAVNKDFRTSLWRVSPTTQAITAATQATPCVITVVGHNLSGGEYVYACDVVGMVELNQQIFKVVRLTDDTLSLDALDDTDVASGTYTAYVSGGTIQEVITTPAICLDNEYVSANKKYNTSKVEIVDLILGEHIKATITGLSDATNFLAVDASFFIKRA